MPAASERQEGVPPHMSDNDPSHDGERGPARAVAVQPQPESAGAAQARPSEAADSAVQGGAALDGATRLKSLTGSIRSRLARPEFRQTLLRPALSPRCWWRAACSCGS